MITPALCGTVEEILGDLEQWKRKGERITGTRTTERTVKKIIISF